MKNHDGQTYCVSCESWIFEKEKSAKKQKFGELVSLQGKQNIKPKDLKDSHNEIAKVYEKSFFTVEKHVVTSLQLKLIYLSNLLNSESDIYRIEKYLQLIKLCIEDIKEAKAIGI